MIIVVFNNSCYVLFINAMRSFLQMTKPIYFAAVPCIPMQLVYNASFSPDGAAFEKPRILTCLPGHWFSVNKYSMVVTCDHNGTWQHLPLGCKGKKF